LLHPARPLRKDDISLTIVDSGGDQFTGDDLQVDYSMYRIRTILHS
jgi:hypothetical protein